MVKIDNPITENEARKNCFGMLRFTLVDRTLKYLNTKIHY